jgi:Zn finger protein HypA/HybF involved in hydrogenase expression
MIIQRKYWCDACDYEFKTMHESSNNPSNKTSISDIFCPHCSTPMMVYECSFRCEICGLIAQTPYEVHYCPECKKRSMEHERYNIKMRELHSWERRNRKRLRREMYYNLWTFPFLKQSYK